MNITYLKPTTIEATAIRCILNIREHYDEEFAEISTGPFAKFLDGRTLTLTLDLDTRTIRDWPTDDNDTVSADLYLKVCDEGKYVLLGAAGEALAVREYYVPSCVPQEYGDYVSMKVIDGAIVEWLPEADEVVECFWPTERS